MDVGIMVLSSADSCECIFDHAIDPLGADDSILANRTIRSLYVWSASNTCFCSSSITHHAPIPSHNARFFSSPHSIQIPVLYQPSIPDSRLPSAAPRRYALSDHVQLACPLDNRMPSTPFYRHRPACATQLDVGPQTCANQVRRRPALSLS